MSNRNVSRNVTIHNRENIAVMHEDDLRMKVNQLRGRIETERRQNNDALEFEVEHCYLSDELLLRYARNAAHEEYLFNNPHVFEEN